MEDVIPMDINVKVYWNLHKRCYSIKYQNKVIAHTSHINLINITFKVSEASRQRVIKHRHKNVHAYVEGTTTQHAPDVCAFIQYDPYHHSGFVLTGDTTNTPLIHADSISMMTISGHPVVIAANVY